MIAPIENEDMPAGVPDEAYESQTSITVLVCVKCRENGVIGAHMLLTDDGLHWRCTECGDERPTPRQIIADTRAAIAEGRRRRLEQMGEAS